ncbi:hypothetical protein [Streptomyces sp. YIM 98790]|uniref:hypothetical protein n=1 Tax=Streptomyces sp. YIM 98790 TaxID=2689077 RepID=UPI001408693B|nr:hypothetical protein [Streptomyces sp. YIM 98790]
MTSTPSERQPVYLEFPGFGYGPAATMLTLARAVPRDVAWHVVSRGGAARFVHSELPGAARHELDTFAPAHWPAFLDIAPPGSLVISGTNPEFAVWAIRHGYRVGIVDTLDWMWRGLPDGLEGAEFHLAQAYFGDHRPTPGDRREYVRPIVDPSLWGPTGPSARDGSVLIGFGGMHLPGGENLVAAYVRWFLGAALPVLTERDAAARIVIAGGRADLAGLVPDPWRTHPAVRVRPAMDRAAYARTARTVQHLIASPGLTSLYECAHSRLTPLWQPGFSMSMVLQIRNLLGTGYPHVAAWPWQAEAAEHIAGLPESAGVAHVAARIADTVRITDPAGETIRKALLGYLDRPEDGPALRLPLPESLPDAGALFAAHLDRLL